MKKDGGRRVGASMLKGNNSLWREREGEERERELRYLKGDNIVARVGIGPIV